VGISYGLYIEMLNIEMLTYPFFEEWPQHRLEKKRLAKCAHHATGRRWDVVKGPWIDE
jgi:hypothetical protein